MGVTPLRAEGLKRRYGDRLAVDVAELDVRAGEILVVLGPNGAGKTTLFRLLLLLERPDEGRILLDGREVRAGDRAALRRIAGVFQSPYLFGGTVAENVGYGLRARGVPRGEREDRVARALQWFGLTPLADAPVHILSAGQVQQVALTRALVLEPEILMLDEPTANLDVTLQRRFRQDLERTVRERAGSAVLITHDPSDAFALADRIAVMDAGRIVQVGRPDELVLRPATPFVAAFTGAELLLDGVVLGRDNGLVRIRLAGGITVLATVAADDDRGLRAGEPVHVAYRPEDIVLVPPDAAGASSARNRFRVRIAGLSPAGGLVRVQLTGEADLIALVTRPGAEALGLAPGSELLAQLKATALRAFAGPRR